MTTVDLAPIGPRLRFELSPERHATAPPEARGLRRDAVRLLVARPERIEHSTFASLGAHLEPGDLVVVNTSATLPAALDGTRPDGRPVVVHVAGPTPDGRGDQVIELRRVDGSGPADDAVVGEVVSLAGGAVATLVAAHPDPAPTRGSRLWRARVEVPTAIADLAELLATHGRPIAYGYVRDRFPLDAYQTAFGRVPGSAEMASAARPFTPEVVTDLVARGIGFATITLHTGVSSLEAGEPPEAERFEVPSRTADLVALTRRSGGRIVAVGTTVTRALETVAGTDGSIAPGAGWTDVVLGPTRPARIVDGLVTGWHEANASHLSLLEAVAGPELVERAYEAALQRDYLWHEFGDSCLLLP